MENNNKKIDVLDKDLHDMAESTMALLEKLAFKAKVNKDIEGIVLAHIITLKNRGFKIEFYIDGEPCLHAGINDKEGNTVLRPSEMMPEGEYSLLFKICEESGLFDDWFKESKPIIEP